MKIESISSDEALRRASASLGVVGETCDFRPMVAAALRRAASILCPCRPWELSRAVWASLRPVGTVAGLDEALVLDVLDEVLLVGDLAEVTFGRESGGDEQMRLCLMPLSFVRRSQGCVVLLGGRAEETTALPADVANRIVYKGVVRELVPRSNEDLPKLLLEFGLAEVEPAAWLRLPKRENSQDHVQDLLARMPSLSSPRGVEGLVVVGPGSYYAGRWCAPSKLSGLFVGRRPQAFGAPIWCAARLSDGQVVSILDLHAPGSRWRPCDVAWQLQAALDATAGVPQSFKRCKDPNSSQTTLEFAAPLPSWAERRLRLCGERIPQGKGLLRFAVDDRHTSDECQFVRDYLWLRESC